MSHRRVLLCVCVMLYLSIGDASARELKLHIDDRVRFVTQKGEEVILPKMQMSFDDANEIKLSFSLTDVCFNLYRTPIFDEFPSAYPEEDATSKCNRIANKTRFRMYELYIDANVGATETLVLTGDDVYGPMTAITGTGARSFLQNQIYTMPELRPIVYAFESVHRFASPKDLLLTVLGWVVDPHKHGCTVQNKTDQYGNLRTYRTYGFNIPNDKPKHYTPRALDKLFTAHSHTTTDTHHTHLARKHTPVKSVCVRVKEVPHEHQTFDQIVYMRFYQSSLTHSHCIHNSAQSDLIIALEALGEPQGIIEDY